uniref:uncharacterized protein LOC117607760 n=1 Tax=Osmia lignaria TaxID=473952 RepID=UPI0014792F96|nr:uncharacterized protein LOC117607760 [Osmia lignaria]
MTPLWNPQSEEKYKEIQIRTRQIVQRTFGVWKRRFPCLTRGLTTKFLCSTATVVACAVLHNLALIFNDILVEEDEIENQNEDGEELLGNVENVNGIDGFTNNMIQVYIFISLCSLDASSGFRHVVEKIFLLWNMNTTTRPAEYVVSI